MLGSALRCFSCLNCSTSTCNLINPMRACVIAAENVRRGEGLMNPWPFRADLLGALKALEPA